MEHLMAILFLLAVINSLIFASSSIIDGVTNDYNYSEIKMLMQPGTHKDSKFTAEKTLVESNTKEKLIDLVKIAKTGNAGKSGDLEQLLDRKLMKLTLDAQAEMGYPTCNLDELMKMKSSWNSETRTSNTTVVLSHFRGSSLVFQLEAILAQSHKPLYVWVLENGSERGKEYLTTVGQYKPKFDAVNVSLHIIKSDLDLRYYGSFQFALQAWTEYIWIISDNVIPGPNMLALLTHSIGIPELRAGVIGTSGWILPPMNESNHVLGTISGQQSLYIEEPMTKLFESPSQSQLVKADVLNSQWFLRIDHVKLIFRNKAVSTMASNGHMLSFALRKYANLEAYILPINTDDPTTWGNIDLIEAFSTKSEREDYRFKMIVNKLWWDLVLQGGSFFWLQYRQFQRSKQAKLSSAQSLVMFIDGVEQAKLMKNLHKYLMVYTQNNPALDLITVITGGRRGTCEAVLAQLDFEPKHELCSGRRFGFFDLKWGYSNDRAETAVTIHLDVMTHLSSVLDLVGSGSSVPMITTVEVGTSEDKIMKSAVKEVARQRSIQYVGLTPHEAQAYSTHLRSFSTTNVLNAWKKNRFTIVLLHLEPSNAGVLENCLQSLAHLYYFGNTVDLILVERDSSDSTREIFHEFEWSWGSKYMKVVGKYDSWTESALEAYYPEKDTEFIILLDSKKQLEKSFYQDIKRQATELLIDPDTSAENLLICLAKDCQSPYYAMSGAKWRKAFGFCVDFMAEALTCEMAFKQEYNKMLDQAV